MKDTDTRAVSLLRRWRESDIPEEDRAVAAARRPVAIRALAQSIRRTKRARVKERRVAAWSIALSFAAGSAAASGVVYRFADRSPWHVAQNVASTPSEEPARNTAVSRRGGRGDHTPLADATLTPPVAPPPVTTAADSAGPGRLVGLPARPASRGLDMDLLGEQNRAFSAAVSARRNGDARECVRLLDDFLGRFRTSPLRQEAVVERFRALEQAGDHAAAARGAVGYLAAYPSGFAAEEARRVGLSPSSDAHARD